VIRTDQLDDVYGKNVVDSNGSKIGKVGQVYLDDDTGQPEWATVQTGMFGTSESFIPLREASFNNGDLAVPFSKDKVKDAPTVATDGHLEPAEEEGLYRYYGLTFGDRGADDRAGTGSPVGRDVSGPETDNAMTRSEERLHVGTERQETGRARLRKHIVTENVTTTVPVAREEVRIEREPITDANRGAAMSGGDLTEEEHEVVLTEERPVVAKETVPVERVRLDKDTITEQQEVSEQVRKEEIDTDTIDGDRRR
jgi:uncharacterized protein (TIGR02271 family)